ncbi:hypothetical protein MED01_005793 [Micromonospora sp. MED01]|uniref:hypothetical protein n=1 Tax=Micromonospora alfalfae TaxID=2911212 RepID=UPI001EE8209C|nr:hypothetical protein [Micromonospora alfalfae]MCG5466751.1 hypothetical protein [Micromonospora alfalfae]
MATLKNSRGKFFHEHKMPQELNFWIHLFRYANRPLPVDDNVLERALEWRPDRSNCPQLTITIEQLIESVPGEWRALANNLFVGRVLKGDLNAMAWTERKAGVIEINVQYSFTLSAYAAAYDEFFHNLKSFVGDVAAKRPGLESMVHELDKRFAEPWEQLDTARSDWADRRLLVAANPVAARWAKGREMLQEDMVDAAESFVIAHELAHHLLGHTVSRRDKRKAKVAVDEAIEQLGAFHMMSQFNQSQREELQADILAYLIVAQALDGTPQFPDIYRAVAGATLALVTHAHVTDSWVELDSAATHPDFTERFNFIYRLTEMLSSHRSADNQIEHPMAFLAQLSTFAAVALNTWASRNFPERQKPAGVLHAADHLLRLMNEVYGRIPQARASTRQIEA